MGAKVIDLSGSNVTEVRRLSDLGTPVGGEIDVDGKSFLLLEPITCPHILVGDTVDFYDMTWGLNPITFTGSIAIKSNNTKGIRIRQCGFTGNGTNKLFDLINQGVSAAEILSCQSSSFVSFGDLGNLTNIALALHQCDIIGFLTGLEQDGGRFCQISGGSMLPFFSSGVIFSISNLIDRTILMHNMDYQFFLPGSNYIMKIDNATTFDNARFTLITTTGEAAFFDPAGLTEQDPRVFATNINNINSSYTGVMSVTGNPTATVISSIGVFVDIAGTTVASPDNERFTHSTSPNELTYIGLESVKLTASFNISALKTGAASICSFTFYVNNSPVPGGLILTDVTTRGLHTGNTTSLTLETNDVIKVMVSNLENTDNITINTLNVMING